MPLRNIALIILSTALLLVPDRLGTVHGFVSANGDTSSSSTNVTGTGIHPEIREYCNLETFNASCPRPSDVVLIRRARYGRMQIGRCVKRNLGYVGCNADVLAVLDSRCSGRRRCDFVIPDRELHETSACPADTTPYLEVAYDCLQVVPSEGQSCIDGQPVPLRDPVGYIQSGWSRDSSSDGHGGTAANCRWLLQAQPGQHFNLTLFHFGRVSPSATTRGQQKHIGYSASQGSDSGVPWTAEGCYELATVTERERATATTRDLTVCGGMGNGGRPSGHVSASSAHNRERHIYESSSNVLEIRLINYATAMVKLGRFIIKYEAVSCPDVEPPKNGLATRNGDTTTVTCQGNSEVWYLTCRGVKWIGKLGNCSHAPETSANAVQKNNVENFPYGILIVVAVGVALGVLLGGLLLIFAVLYMRRKHRTREDLPSAGTTLTSSTAQCMLIGSPHQFRPLPQGGSCRAGATAHQLHQVEKYLIGPGPTPSGCGGGWFESTIRSTELSPPPPELAVGHQLYWDQTIKFVPDVDGFGVDVTATPELSERSWTRVRNGDGLIANL